MKFKSIVVLCYLIFICVGAKAMPEEVALMRGITSCGFIESKKGSYSYCNDKIKRVVINVEFAPIEFNPTYVASVGSDYIYSYIHKVYQKLDEDIDELNYEVVKIYSHQDRVKFAKKNYLHVNVKFVRVSDNRFMCILFVDRNGEIGTDGFMMNVSRDDYDNTFKNELEKIVKKLESDLILRSDE
jgi:hypothetical protein